ncbi:MBL fold metallo-hydrolase [Thauera linaloolentis]|uniref:Beta-lactamase n=1 Tax=Thauera linaloolentis (strain DSM 12138 / JCM 21573 / CCUG 41526 / CIP 105981 / IAM 15112 / NBRC 102519 / 47Lol) TaxID=1123367 RepID=N6Z7Q5_THAL4|nr:MBL fold metallo-hydrolase [Thauera linaloolentis]ENO90627.1 beta-lactamase [Thauera linaloolentis 47Lol = DSM 12138]MCM8566133.1 MBL fold metallo-hydrolase [Thauera linaloolentis]
MNELISYPDGIHALESGYGRPLLAAIHIVVDEGRAAIIDTGSNNSVPRVLSALAVLGIAPENVEWVMLTHIHLDHAGGAGSLMCALPQAKLLVHPRGLRHMIDPGRLWEGTSAVYGAERAYELYGRLVPVPPERIVPATEGLEVRLGKRLFRLFDTPGHARHHICIWDDRARVFFTGDTFGLSYRELDVDGRVFVLPTTTPTQFEPEAMHESIDRMLAMQPQAMYLTHYSRVTDVSRLGADLHRLIDAMVAVARAARGDGVARHVEILAGLEQVIREEAGRQGWALDEEQTLELLRMDLELNAQGLGVWLDSQRAVEPQPA